MNTIKIDWITATKKLYTEGVGLVHAYSEALTIARSKLKDVGLYGGNLVRQNAIMRYPWRWLDQDTQTMINVSENPAEQGIMLVLSGQATTDQQWTRQALRALLDDGWNVTRIDIALDIYNSGKDAQDVFFAHRVEQPNERKKRGFIQSDKGSTFTLGSRSSNKYLRVYDKGKEQGTQEDWLRVEMEYKGDAAPIAAALANGNLQACVADMMNFLGQTLPEVTEAMYELANGYQEKITVVRKTQTDRARWVEGTVFPAWRTWAEEEPGAAWDAIYRLIQDISDIVTQPETRPRIDSE